MARTSNISPQIASAAKNIMCTSICSGLPRIAMSSAITWDISTETVTKRKVWPLRSMAKVTPSARVVVTAMTEAMPRLPCMNQSSATTSRPSSKPVAPTTLAARKRSISIFI